MNQEIENLFYSAQKAHQNSDFLNAESLYKQILNQKPEHTGTLHFLGILYGQQKKYDDAVYNLNKAFATSPNNPKLCNDLAEAYQRKGNTEEAIKYFKKAIDIAPDFYDPYYNLGIVLRDTGNFPEAIKYVRKAISINPGHFDAYQNLGNILIFQENYQEANYYFKQALNINPKDAGTFNNIGFTFYKTGKNEEAAEYYKKAIKLNPYFIEAYNNLKNLLLEMGKIQEAMAVFSRANALIGLKMQELPTKFIIHEYTWDCCGFADFLRSSLMLQKICLQKNIEYFVHFPNHPFRELFNYRMFPMTDQEINGLPSIEIFHVSEKAPVALASEFLKFLNTEKIRIRVRSNYQFIEPPPAYCPLDVILTPKQEVTQRKNQLIDELQLRTGEYNSFHVRLGDDYLINKKHLTEDDALMISKIEEHILDIIKEDPEKKVLFFSDSNELKDLICARIPQVLKLNTSLIHVGITESRDLTGFIDTICEFLILGEGVMIYSFSHPNFKLGLLFSEFAKWSAITHGKEYFLLR